jgi:outer membrane protein TolC
MNRTHGGQIMTRTPNLLLPALLLAGLPVGAAGFSFHDFRAEVEARDPSLRAQAAQLRQAEAARDEARGALLPSLGVTTQYTRVSDAGDGSVTLPIPGHPVSLDLNPYIPNQWVLAARAEQVLWDGRSLSRWQAARHEGEAARAGVTKARRDLGMRALQAWCDLWTASRELEAADSARAAYAEQVRVLSLQVREGTALANDSLRAALLLRQSELALLSARMRIEASREKAGTLLGRPLDASVLTDSVPEVDIPATGDETPELLQARERLLSSDWQEKAQRSAFLPTVSLGGQVEDMAPNPRVVPAQDAARMDWKVWVVAQWSLFRGGSDWYGTHRAAAAREEASLRLQADDARRTLALAEERRATARELVRLSREDRTLLARRADAGTALRSDLLDRIGQEWKARADLAQAEASRTLAAASLRLALGLEP